MSMRRSQFFNRLASLSLAGLALSASAQTYPSKPVTLVVPFVPGGQMDLTARMLAEPLTKLIGQTVVVDTRAGAGGNIGYSSVARSAKDGYTLLVGYSGTHACSPSLYSNLPWEQKDFIPIGMLTSSTHVITVHPSVPVNNLKELIAYLKENPGKVDFASSGTGSLSHIGPLMFEQQTQTSIVHVPYKGTGAVMQDFLAGRIKLYFPTPPAVIPFIKAGKLKALAVTSATRNPSLPDVPTASEAGLPNFELVAWVALFAPAGTPADAVAKLSAAVKQATETPEFSQRANAAGIETKYLSPEATAAQIRRDTVTCASTVARAGIKAE
jgi:tripartite-type tricarboxylate transporter receptor subunit TctC